MRRPVAKVAAVHDLSGYGRASLTVALPVMAALGVQVCPLPTALLSTQTSGFSSYYYRDLTDDMYKVMEHWRAIGLTFDGIYSGFLGSSRQIACVEQLVRTFSAPSSLTVIDPVMGDDGEPYGPISREHIELMRRLIGCADVITPNFTEAMMLLDEPYRDSIAEDELPGMLERLLDAGPKQAVITSVPVQGREENCMLYASDRSDHKVHRMTTPRIPVSYPGSGDMFASILTASMLQNGDFLHAAALGAEYVSRAIREAAADGVPEREGLLIEAVLPDLAAGHVSFQWEALE